VSVCAQCGAELDIGRFCTNCGHPVGAPVPSTDAEPDWRTATAERPAVGPDPAPPPVVPPPVTAATTPPRFPLYADEPAPLDDTAAFGTPPSHRHAGPRTRDSRPGWLPWLAGALALLLFAGLGAWLLLGGDDDPGPTAADRAAATPSETPQPTREPSPTESAEPSDEPSADGQPADLARTATATVPATAEPNQDVDGNLVRYEARNMLDGVPETTWRMPGDGTGETLTFDFDSPVTLTSVGMVNGYAKTAREGGTTLDWYAGNRRVLAVEWLFDDGTLVRQDLEETRTLQSIDVDPVTTESVQVRLVTVTPPGRGPSARNYTAVSEVSLVGTPAQG
jgi:hypothetical protein